MKKETENSDIHPGINSSPLGGRFQTGKHCSDWEANLILGFLLYTSYVEVSGVIARVEPAAPKIKVCHEMS